MNRTTKIESSTSVASQSTPYTNTSPQNPYQRMASRRAIACVTCAKAKTKCDRGLPACSRCITKGIKCEPRSTRRTSDNSYRASIKKAFVSPKRHHSTSNIPSLNQYTRHGKSSPSVRHKTLRTIPHMSFRTAVKMNQQASTCSGFPTLTPLPTYTSPTLESYYSYPVFSDHQDVSEYAPALEANDYPVAGRLTPQTPEPLVYHDPISMEDMSSQWMASQPWPDDSFGPIELGFDADISTILPTDFWPASANAHAAPAEQISWYQASLSASPQEMSHELVPHPGTVPSLSLSECSAEDFSGSGVFHGAWANCHPMLAQLGTASMVAQAPFMHGHGPGSSTAPMWEDVFMHESAPY